MSSTSVHAIPAGLVSAEEYEQHAEQCLSPAVFAHINGGSGNEHTLRRNREAFEALTLQPRLLADCRHGNTRCELFGQAFRHPLLLAPVALQALVHPEGELASAQGAAAMEAGMVCSTLSSFTLEYIAARHPFGLWFQLYFQPRREHTLDLVQRAEAAGYRSLMVTLDTPVQAASPRAQRAGFSLPAGIQAANLQRYPPPERVTLGADQSIIFQGMMSEAPGWQDLEWLLDSTGLPVIVKGVTHPTDATRLAKLGVRGQVVSNHGGRALDHAPASLDCLPAIRRALGNDYPLLLDSGIRSGSDAFKALACGANAVLIGRPCIHALAVAGALGVAHVLKLLREELELCMALTGCPTLKDISREALFPIG